MPDDLLSNLSAQAQQVLPEHVAIIMDGNGRWAKQRRLPRTVGHRRGLESCERLSGQPADWVLNT